MVFLGLTSAQGQNFVEQSTSVSNVELTVSNNLLIGNAFKGIFRAGEGSAEYPTGSSIEHMFQGGLWIGGINRATSQPQTATAYIDNSSGYDCGNDSYDFFPAPGFGLFTRSTLPSAPDFDPVNAVSQQDFVATAVDTIRFCPGTATRVGGSGSLPMGLAVDMEYYNWSFEYANFFVIGNYTIRNVGNNTFDSLYVGFLTNGVVRNTNLTAAGTGGAQFYNKGGNGFLDEYNMSYDWDVSGEPEATGTYFAQKFLGASNKNGSLVPGQNGVGIHYNTWVFQNTANFCYAFPGRGQGEDDITRYERMTQGLNDYSCWDTLVPSCDGCAGGVSRSETHKEEIAKAGNRSNLISVGPFGEFLPGDSVTFTIAFLFAEQTGNHTVNNVNIDNDSTRQELVLNAEVVQNIFENEFQLPEPPPSPFVNYIPQDGRIVIEWADNGENVPDPQTEELDFEGYNIYLTQLGYDVVTEGGSDISAGSNLQVLKTYDIPGNGIGFDNGFSSVLHPNPYDTTVILGNGQEATYTMRYRYVIENLNNGWQYGVAVTSFDRGNENIGSLENAPSQTLKLLFPGKSVNGDISSNEPFVYPNPYYSGASWEGNTIFEENRKLNFANLPERCVIKIFTPAGDLIDEINHDAATYAGGVPWYDEFSDPENAEFSGGEHSWNLLSKDNQIISRGLYIFTIEEQDQTVYKGTFTVIK